MDFISFLREPVLLGLCSLALLQMGFSLFFFIKPLMHKPLEAAPQPLSIIIIARNELENLKHFLDSILQQNHPDFEVIVVNNGSWDQSLEYLTDLKKTAPRLKVVNIPDDERFRSGKKLAITLGIKAASKPNLLLTDADCYPASENWASMMSGNFADGNLVLGISRYEQKKGFLNLCIAYETMQTALTYTGFALAGKPYMGVGRNLGYTSQLYYSVKGFASHHHIEAGDDDLFVRDVAAKAKVKVCLTMEAHTISIPKINWRDWIKQKTRHINTGKYYATDTKLLLWLYHASALGVVTLFIMAAFMQLYFHALLPFGMAIIMNWIIAGAFAWRLGEKRVVALMPVFYILHPLFLIFIGIRTFVIRNVPW